TPDKVVVCDGSEEERERLTKECLATGELIELNQQKLPGCYLHRSAPHDVARTEHLTFVCTRHKEEAGPNNNWMPPSDAKTKLAMLFPPSSNPCWKVETLGVDIAWLRKGDDGRLWAINP